MTVARLAVALVAGIFALTALIMLAAIGIHNAFEWWGSGSARGLKSLPRTFIRWLKDRKPLFRRAPRTLVTVRWATVDEILADEGVRREIIEALDRESPLRRMFKTDFEARGTRDERQIDENTDLRSASAARPSIPPRRQE